MPLKHSDYLQHSNQILAKQPYFPFISLAFCNAAKSKAPAKSFAQQSVEQQPNLRHNSQTCGTAAKSVAQQPNMWPGSQICGLATKPPDSGHTCGTAVKSVARRPNLWNGAAAFLISIMFLNKVN